MAPQTPNPGFSRIFSRSYVGSFLPFLSQEAAKSMIRESYWLQPERCNFHNSQDFPRSFSIWAMSNKKFSLKNFRDVLDLKWYQQVFTLRGFYITQRFYITRRIHDINRVSNGINRLINCITRLINGLIRLINGWGAWPGPWGRGPAPPPNPH